MQIKSTNMLSVTDSAPRSKGFRSKEPISVSHPEVCPEWHPDNVRSSDQVTYGSNIRVKWKCSKNHVWMASPNARIKATGKIHGCPYCTGVMTLAGETDLATAHPDIASEWSSRNLESPNEVRPRSCKKVWWKCHHGHEWRATIQSRTARGTGCPYCSGRYVVSGVNDLATTHPQLASEWCDDIRVASSVGPGSSYRPQWRCAKGHVWKATVISRVSRGYGCPYCAGRQVYPGFNDLASHRPDLVKEWDPSNDHSPEQVTRGSGRCVKWICPEGHTYSATVVERASRGQGCPFCAGRRVLKGFNDLGSCYPNLLEEWDSPVDPYSIHSGSDLRIKWRCQEGHRWEAPVNRRSSRGLGCPYCGGQKAILGVNDIATLRPDLVAEWHVDNEVRPSHVKVNSSIPVRWKCRLGHDWVVSPNSRNGHRGTTTGCPVCWDKVSESRLELELREYVASVLPEGARLRASDKSVIAGRYELDIYLPDYQHAFEFNGVYWHSDAVLRDKDRHRKKFLEAEGVGVVLVQVWEDDWTSKKDTVRAEIKSRLDVLPLRGRVTTHDISADEAHGLLSSVSVRGFSPATRYLGLFCGSSLVATLGVDDRLPKWKITCIGSRVNLSESVGALLRGLIGDDPDTARKIVFTDVLTYPVGHLFEKNGFVRTSTSAAKFSYLYRANRVVPKNLTTKFFQDADSLIYDSSKSAAELARINALYRVWDAGTRTYSWSSEGNPQ